MPITPTKIAARRDLLPALAGLAALGAGFAQADGTPSPAPGASSAPPFRCAVFATPQGASTMLEAVVESDVALAGTYRFAVNSSGGGGRSQVNQGGPFSIPASRAVLGTVTVGANAQSDIVFDLVIDGTTWSCAPTLA